MSDLRLFGNTSNLIRFVLKNATTGVGLTGLTSATSGLIISTIADVEATATAYTVAGSTIETITTLGTFATPTATKCRFKEVDATNHKGLYEFQFANARFAVTNARRLIISVTGAANLLDADYEIQLVQFDPYNAVRLGLTALPNAAAEAAGGLYTRGTGAGQINQNANGQVDARTVTMAADVVTASALATDAVTEIQAGLSTLTAAGVRTAVGLASANLDTQLTAIDDFLDTEVLSIKTKTDQLTFTTTNKVDSTIQAAGDFAQSAADKVWSTTTRALTDKVGFALSAPGIQAIWDAVTSALTTVGSLGKLLVDNVNATISSRLASASYTAPLDEAGIRTAVGLATANLDTQLGTIDGRLDTEIAAILAAVDTDVAAIKAQTDLLPASPAATGAAMTLTSGERSTLAAVLLDLADAVEAGLTVRQALRLIAAAEAGKVSGMTTATVTIRNAVADSTNRIVAQTDSDGNRTAITYNVT